jgi:hypothetical protein
MPRPQSTVSRGNNRGGHTQGIPGHLSIHFYSHLANVAHITYVLKYLDILAMKAVVLHIKRVAASAHNTVIQV